MEAVYDIKLVKNGITEQELYAQINLVEEVPPNSGFDLATRSDYYNDNDFAFGYGHGFISVHFLPNENQLSLSIDIFNDYLQENTEAAQLTIDTTTDERNRSPLVELLPNYPTFFIIIQDNDGNYYIHDSLAKNV